MPKKNLDANINIKLHLEVIIKKNHLATIDKIMTKVITQETINKRKQKAIDFLRIDPNIDCRSLGRLLGCNKDTALNDKKEALMKIAFEK